MTHVEGSGHLGEVEYAELVARVHATVTASVPPGASVLVVSKGDAALVEIPGLAAAHFPQDASGDYAGYHPRDSTDATAQLRRLHLRGAEYLVIPATGRWWLKFYGGFAEHLASHCELVADVADACLIYGLGRRGAQIRDIDCARPQASIEQMRDYLENLIPKDTQVAVLETGAELAPALAPVQAAAVGGEELERGSDEPLSRLAWLAQDGVDYLVVPRLADEWLDGRPELVSDIESRCRKIADQRHLCRVYDLTQLRAA